MGRLFDLVEAHRDARRPYEPSYSQIAEQVGVTRQTLLNWRTPAKLIKKEYLAALAKELGVPYQRVLDALLEDIGYLHEAQAPVAARRGRSTGQSQRQAQDVDATAPDPEGPEGGA
jgi:transcriptional regulator with XRE-family HTH domain